MPRVIVPVLLLAPLAFSQTTTGSVEGVVVDRVTRAGIPGPASLFTFAARGLFTKRLPRRLATSESSG
jgi:hypothetical protein